MAKKNKQKTFRVVATYSGLPFGDIDGRICKAAGREDSGSGFAFLTQERDLSFSGLTRPTALKMAERIRKIKGVKTTICQD